MNEAQSQGLKHMLTPETVRARLTADNWEVAADLVGNLLVEAGTVEAIYVTAMKDVLREMGGYAVLAPGIVLLHARPEQGVIHPTFGLVTLNKAVPFGNEQNDPVDIVFAFGAVDKEGHLQALKELAGILSDEATIQRIRSAADDGELLRVLHTHSN
jgi:mannitol/fructose-specific phosphotransferase system IIA component (Ntr-type)